MNICIISGFSGNPDEGMKNFAYNITQEFKNKHNIMHLNARRNIISFKFWKEVAAFNPEIIHIFLRPNIMTLLFAKFLQIHSAHSKIVISSLQPPEHKFFIKIFGPLIKPDAILYQSAATQEFFEKLGWMTLFSPSGVNIEKFSPVSDDIKKDLRQKYGISTDKFVVLHVGHINKNRNLGVLKRIAVQFTDIDVLVVGSTNDFNFDQDELNDLRNSGCLVLRRYFENIEELYQLADCYIFPTVNASHAIEIPLSVLEAMACNLPVITTKFGGLTRILKNCRGVHFAVNPEDITNFMNSIKVEKMNANTRNCILHLSWKAIAEDLEGIYSNLLLKEVS